jgi:hypothetical protein
MGVAEAVHQDRPAAELVESSHVRAEPETVSDTVSCQGQARAEACRMCDASRSRPVASDHKFTEPGALSSPVSTDLRLPPCALSDGFVLLASLARCRRETTTHRDPAQGVVRAKFGKCGRIIFGARRGSLRRRSPVRRSRQRRPEEPGPRSRATRPDASAPPGSASRPLSRSRSRLHLQEPRRRTRAPLRGRVARPTRGSARAAPRRRDLATASAGRCARRRRLSPLRQE